MEKIIETEDVKYGITEELSLDIVLNRVEQSVNRVIDKVNEIVRVVNNLENKEREEPIYELLDPHAVLIISRSAEGLLVVTNDGWGRALMERIPWPKEEEEK